MSFPSGSTPMTRQPGRVSLTAAAKPPASPPPPIGTITASRSGAWRSSSRPSVAVPSAVRGPSNGWTKLRPSSRSIRVVSANAACTSPVSTTSAPSPRQRATRNGSAVSGITTLALVPRAPAAHATAIAWFPALTAVTPRASASGSSDCMTESAPRALKLPAC